MSTEVLLLEENAPYSQRSGADESFQWAHSGVVLEIPQLIRNSKCMDSETSSVSEIKSTWRLYVQQYLQRFIWPHQHGLPTG